MSVIPYTEKRPLREVEVDYDNAVRYQYEVNDLIDLQEFTSGLSLMALHVKAKLLGVRRSSMPSCAL